MYDDPITELDEPTLHEQLTLARLKIEQQSNELTKLKGFIGYYTSMICPDCFYGNYDAAQIEKGLSADVRTIFHSDGGITITTGMGS